MCNITFSTVCFSGLKSPLFGLLLIKKIFYTDLGTVEAMLEGSLVQEVEEPLDGGREVGRHLEDGAEEVVHKLLDGALRGEQPGQEDLRDGLVGPGG
jgi:hypothetical protein